MTYFKPHLCKLNLDGYFQQYFIYNNSQLLDFTDSD